MKIIISVLLFVIYTASYANAADITLTWDQNPETDLLGYRGYYKIGASGAPYNGTGADQGSSPILILIEDLLDPEFPDLNLTGLDGDEIYYFVVTAHNDYGESGYSNEVHHDFGRTGLWSGATELGGGWLWLDWFGYFNDNFAPWINHQYLGWLYADLNQTVSSIFFWDLSLGWVYTSDSTYPWFWWFGDATWLFYSEGTTNPRWFYNVDAGAWQTY